MTTPAETEALYRSWDTPTLVQMKTALESDRATSDDRAFFERRLQIIARILAEREAAAVETPSET